MDFAERIDEDLKGALAKVGRLQWNKTKQAGINLKHYLWAYLGDAKAEGTLELNQTTTRLFELYAQFIGRTAQETTVKSFLDFVQAMKAEGPVPTKTLIAALGGKPNIKAPSPNAKQIRTIFNKIVGDKVPRDRISQGIDKLVSFQSDEDKFLVMEYARFLSQKKPEVFDQPEFSKLVPYLDRRLGDDELKTMMGNLAKALLRSKTVEELTGSSEKGSPVDKKNSDVDRDVDRDGKDDSETMTGHILPRGQYIANLNKLNFEEDMHQEFREHPEDAAFWESSATNLLAQLKNYKRINAVSANVFSMMVSYSYIEEEVLIRQLYQAERKLMLNEIQDDQLRGMRLNALRGQKPTVLAAQFDKLYNTEMKAAKWLSILLRVENIHWLKKHNVSDT